MEKAWEKFIKSGHINDYLNFVNKRREQEISEGSRNAFYDRGIGDTGTTNRGE